MAAVIRRAALAILLLGATLGVVLVAGAQPDRHLPSAPRDLQATATETGVHLAWAEPADPGEPRFTIYLLYLAPEGQVLVERARFAGATTMDLALDPGAYDIALSAANDLGEGPRASTRVIVPSPAPAPPPAPGPSSRALSTPQEAAGAMATGAAIVVAAALAPRLFDFLRFLRDAAMERAANEFQERTAHVGARRFRLPGWIALPAALAALAVLFSLPDAERTLAGVMEALPVVGVASLVFVAGAFGAEWLLAAAGGARLRFKLWAMGTVSLVVTSLVFRQPFGATGFLEEGEGEGRGEGVRALGALGGAAAMALPFLLLGRLVHAELGEVGVEMALAYFAIATLPVKPFPGRELWRWSKAAWGALAAVSLTTYYLYEVGSLPDGAILVAGGMGALLLAWAGWIAARRGTPGVPQPRLCTETRHEGRL